MGYNPWDRTKKVAGCRDFSMSSNKSSSIIKKFIPAILLGFIALVGLALFGDLREVKNQIAGFRWQVFPLVLLLTLFNYTLRFFKWHFYLHQVGVKTIPLLRSAQLFVAGFPLAMTPGKVGEVLKGVWLKQDSGLPVARGVSVVVAERISDGFAVLVLSTLGVLAYPQYWPAFAVILGVLLALVVLSQIRPAAMWALGVGEKLPVVKRFVGVLRDFYEGSWVLFKPGPTLLAVGLGSISWLGEGIGFYLILTGLGMTPSSELLGLAVFILAFSTIIGSVTALPGGLGAAEVSIAGMLALLAGADAATASTATLMIRFATLWFGMSLGLLVWAFSPRLLGLRGGYEQAIES